MEHPIVTRDYPENLKNGIMVCGIDFGFSAEDARRLAAGEANVVEEASFFADPNVRKTDKFRARITKWLESWGLPLTRSENNLTVLDKSFFQTNWLNEQNHKNSGPIKRLLGDDNGSSAQPILSVIAERKPRVIIFSGANLIQALNHRRIRDQVEKILGARTGNAVVRKMGPVEGSKRVFKVLVQDWPELTVISLPHATGSRGLSDAYMAQFARILGPIIFESE